MFARSVSIDFIQSKSEWQIKLSGSVEAVPAAKAELQQAIKGIRCDKRDIDDKPGKKLHH